MLQFLQCPQWFSGFNTAIDVFSALVLVLIAGVSFRYYMLYRIEKHYLLLSVGYAILALAFILKSYANYILSSIFPAGGMVSIAANLLFERAIAFEITFLAYILCLLLGLYILFTIVYPQSRASQMLTTVLLVVSAYVGREHYVIYQGIVLVFFVFLAWAYWQRYQQNKLRSTAFLTTSFFLLALSALLFITVSMHSALYAVAAVVQLIGFIGLLVTFLMVAYNGKKQVSTRHHA
jgi:hypothetical protein